MKKLEEKNLAFIIRTRSTASLLISSRVMALSPPILEVQAARWQRESSR